MNESITVDGHILHRIRALRNFATVKPGDLGGYIESESNLSHEGNCWAYDDAQVYENAHVYEDAWVCENSQVSGNAKMGGYSEARGYTRIYGNARVYGDIAVCEEAHIYGDAHVEIACDDGLSYIYIGGCTKIDHGIWTHEAIKIDGKWYLISSTLEKVLLSFK